MASISVTQDEILDAIRAAVARAPATAEGAYSIAEYAAMLRWSDKRVRDAIRALLAAGAAELVQVVKPRLDGRLNTVPAYRLKAPAKKSGRAK